MRSTQIVHKSTIEYISFQEATRLQRAIKRVPKARVLFARACATREREIDGETETRRQSGKKTDVHLT